MIKQSSLLSVTILISSLSTSLFALDPRSIVQQWGPKAAAGATALYATYKLASDTAGYASGSTQADADILAAALLSGDQLMAAMNDPEANQYKNLSSLGKKKQIAEKMKTGKLVLAPVFYLDFVKYGFKSAKDAMNEEVFDEQLEKWSALTDSAKIQNIATRLEKGSLYLSAKKFQKAHSASSRRRKPKRDSSPSSSSSASFSASSSSSSSSSSSITVEELGSVPFSTSSASFSASSSSSSSSSALSASSSAAALSSTETLPLTSSFTPGALATGSGAAALNDADSVN